tara:strand:+ start:1683 stop:1883 length:201 start_codon:yes stop_codon:yes gene_type:complete
MILVTFENQETLEFTSSEQEERQFNAMVHIDLYRSYGYNVEKLRCDNTSDSIAIQNYIDSLNNNIQ